MRMKLPAPTLLIALVGFVLIGPSDLNHTSGAERIGFPRPNSNGAVSAPLASFPVTNLNDSGPGSLRQAILDSNMNPGADVITFSVTGTITLTTGELLITDDLNIQGPGATVITISGNNASRVFLFVAGLTGTMSDLTISSGNAGVAAGGGIFNDGGSLTVTNSTVSSNTGGSGGGIASFGTTTITNSTLSGNTGASGGGILNAGGTTTITNSTVSGNFAGLGFGVYNFGGTTKIINTSLVNNAGIFSDRGEVIFAGPLSIKNSFVAGSTAWPNCARILILTASGTNYSTDSSCTGVTQVTHAQLNLGSLANNGGPTQTHALLAGSIAIDAATDCTDLASTPITTDQRGLPRPLDGDVDGVLRCDVGAYEAPAGISFDLCIQDDSSGYIFKLNSATGEYRFINCSGFILGGRGSLVVKGSTITLQHSATDRRILVRLDSRVNKATASIQALGQGTTFSLVDRNTSDNTCACTVQ